MKLIMILMMKKMMMNLTINLLTMLNLSNNLLTTMNLTNNLLKAKKHFNNNESNKLFVES